MKPHVICSDLTSVQAILWAQALLQELITSSRNNFFFLRASKGHSPVDPWRRGSGLIKAFWSLWRYLVWPIPIPCKIQHWRPDKRNSFNYLPPLWNTVHKVQALCRKLSVYLDRELKMYQVIKWNDQKLCVSQTFVFKIMINCIWMW